MRGKAFRFEPRCMLCAGEAATTAIAGTRVGERCHSRAMAIAAEACTLVDRVIEYMRSGGIVCTWCGAELVVDEVTLTLSCPNNHAVALIPATPIGDPPAPSRPGIRICSRCHEVVERSAGQIGATPKYHTACMTETELVARAQNAKASAAWYVANKSRWIEYGERKKKRRAARLTKPMEPAVE